MSCTVVYITPLICLSSQLSTSSIFHCCQIRVHSEGISQQLPQTFVPGIMNDNLAAADSGRVAICAFCRQYLLSNDLSSDCESSICGDCKFLFLEDFENPIQEGYRTPLQARRRRFSNNGSYENLFLQQSPQRTSPASQIRAIGSEYDDSIDGNASLLAFQSSSRTTPSGSRRWRSLSHTESEMYDSDSSLSFGVCSVFQGGSDITAYGVQVWDSDVSVDDNSFLENELSPLPVELRDAESDTDIDPMNAGFYSWDSDDPEETVEAADNVWEGMDAGNNTFTAIGFGGQLHRSPSLNVEHPELVNDNPIQRDSIGTRVFNELIESLARTDESRIGAPPAAVSFVDNLPQIVIREDVEKLNDFSCAICKDSLPVGTVVNQLPCSHMYHSNCILPWLSTRNSCPLCRYELPTDDPDYEEKKQMERSPVNMNIITEQDTNEENDDSSAFGDAEADFQLSETNRNNTLDNLNVVPSQGGARRCFFLAAAPVVGIVSIVLMFCFGNSVRHRRWSFNQTGFGAPG